MGRKRLNFVPECVQGSNTETDFISLSNDVFNIPVRAVLGFDIGTKGTDIVHLVGDTRIIPTPHIECSVSEGLEIKGINNVSYTGYRFTQSENFIKSIHLICKSICVGTINNN